MSIRQLRRSALVAAGVVALAVAGMFAGRLSADAFPHSGHGGSLPRMFGRIARALDLTADQQAQIKNVLRGHAAEIETQMTAGRSARQALHQALMAQPTDEATIRARAADLGKVQGDGAVLFARIRTEVDPILTPAQRDKLQAFHSHAGGHGDHAVQAFEKFLKSAS
jgi:Spy/CpxP family protein refolding chaperone